MLLATFAVVVIEHPGERLGQGIALGFHPLGLPDEIASACDRCRRGLLHLKCNTAVGYIEKYTELARPYLDRFAAPPAA